MLKKDKMMLFVIFSIFLSIIFITSLVQAKSYQTLLAMDEPKDYGTSGKDLYIQGWYMSQNSNTEVEVYVEDQKIENIERYKRPDVIAQIHGYGTESENPLPGYRTTVDMSGYQDGTYTVTVKVLDSNTKEVITQMQRHVILQKYKTQLAMDEPKDYGTSGKDLYIQGWYMSQNSNTEVEVYVEDQKIENIERYKRPDVIAQIHGYGTESENPLPGYRTTVDMSGYQDGTYTVTVKVLDSNTKEVITQMQRHVILQKYKTQLAMDEPKDYGTSGKDLYIQGWYMSQNTRATVEVYVNDQKIENVERYKRPDVIAQIHGYGTETENPLPGYRTTVDMSGYQDGTYIITAKVLDPRTREIIATQQRHVILQKYKTQLAMDEPKDYGSDNKDLYIQGWYMSQNARTNIEIYVNDQKIENVERYKRPDVIAQIHGYGTKSENPLPGYRTTVDMSGYQDGTYTVTVKVFDSRTGEIIATQQRHVIIEKYKTQLAMDEPKDYGSDNKDLYIQGWYMSENSNTEVEVYVNDQKIENVERYKRPDVINAVHGYGTKSENPLPGYRTTVDMSGYQDGTYTVTVKVLNTATNEVMKEQTRHVNIKKYKTALALDEPKDYGSDNKDLYIQGWYMSENSNTEVEVYVNDQKIENVERYKRPDVINAVHGYGTESENPLPGYRTTVDMSGYKDGMYTVTVKVLNTETNEVMEKLIRHVNIKKYDGIIALDYPKRSTFSDGFDIIGWEMSELDNSYLKVYIDSTQINLEMERYQRQDVLDAIKGYGGASMNETPGYSTYLDLTSIAEGRHVLQLKLYTKLNEEIASISKEIFVYRSIKFGIDVSKYNGDINWNAVRNDGIDFAMIRVGFRGYGQAGTLNEDPYFLTNVNQATSAGVDIGLYFFSQAVNEREAIDEAEYVLNKMNEYGITGKVKYPIVIDTEYSSAPNHTGRADGLNVQERTNVCRAFCERIKQAGYTPMIYASKYWLRDNLDRNQLQGYDIWLAHYTGTNDPINNPSDYDGTYQMWQYTSKGSVSGINGNVDMNLCYKKY